MTAQDWWKGAVFYQIYPRSFQDTNGDGVGDFAGITQRLDYVASLGVDAIWLSPFFKSPMKDYGYDVSDYRDVDPLFGTMDDFKRLLNRAHELGLKVVIDQVYSHTSDQHPWFQESRSSRINPKANWYVWADPKEDGSPPNNWQSHFGGPSWEFDIRRGQYYLHNFLKEQPDLNLYDPAVRKALLDSGRFWLDMGVDGFRLDAVTCFFHSPGLKDNPVNPNPAPSQFNVNFSTPFSMQRHTNDHLIPEALAFAEEIRSLLDWYEGRMAVGEVGGDDGIALAAKFTDGVRRFHTAYNFSLLSGEKANASFIRKAVMEFLRQPTKSWPSWAFSNHDVVRVASRWHTDKRGYHHDPRFSKMLNALLFSLYGTIFLYQGEELGLPEVTISYDKIQDPWGKYLYPQWQGRDGCRTPMPWSLGKKYAGFSEVEPWLPVSTEHQMLAVNRQEEDEESTLNFTRRFLKWRKEHPALVSGSIEFIDMKDDGLLVFRRILGDQSVLCVFNLTSIKKIVILEGKSVSGFDAGVLMGTVSDSKIILPPCGVYVA